MKNSILALGITAVGMTFANAEGNKEVVIVKKKSKVLLAHSQKVGAAGIAWYTTWETAQAEAKRTNRPIFFMSAATCKVPGAS